MRNVKQQFSCKCDYKKKKDVLHLVQESKSAQNMAGKYCEGQNTQKYFTGNLGVMARIIHNNVLIAPDTKQTQFEVNPWLSSGFEVDRANRQS